MALKLKKLKIQRVEQADAQILNLEEVLSNIEWATAQAQVVEGLKQGNAILQKMHSEVSIDDVEQLMEDTAEARATQDEISAALGGGELSTEDEEACLAELEAIEALETDELAAKLPDVPTTELPGATVKVPAGTVDPSTVELLDQLPEAPTGPLVQPAKEEAQAEERVLVAA
jgi:charged multivesicular body protein 6